MKAYIVRDSVLNPFEGGMFVMVIAETTGKAKHEALLNKMGQYTEDSQYVDLRVKRLPECDYLSKGVQTTVTNWDIYKKHGLCRNYCIDLDECETCEYKTNCKRLDD